MIGIVQKQCFVLIIFLSFSPNISCRKLIQGNIIWRHGDRSPMYTYPNDPYKDVWTDGPYQLTEQGKYQAYNLGLLLKSKYGHILSKNYQSDEIFIKSTDLDRSKMSAQCVVAGLYSPSNTTEWKGRNTPWIPFPLHTTEISQDWLANIYQDPEKGCPKFHKYLDTALANEINEINQHYAPEFQYITKMTGVTEEINFTNFFLLHDNLLCLQANGYTLPTWADDKIMKMFKHLAALYVATRFTDMSMIHTKLLSKLRTGVILEKVLENMIQRINGESNYSFIGYSGHDWSIASTLISMGAYNWKVPSYASCLMLDLYEETNGTYSVEFWYQNDSNSNPFPISFYDCKEICSFDKFRLVASLVATDHGTASLCESNSESGYIVQNFLVYVLYTVISILFITSIAYECLYDSVSLFR